MKQIFLISLIATAFAFISNAQKKESYDYHPPLKIPLILSSNFGELRPNHFHMGLDFKTNNKIGYRLYSIEEGYISRIKVSPYGYGKVVYIDHPNGITSVYAHCSEFKGIVDSLVRIAQKEEQNYAVEIFPPKGVAKVKRGEVIALSGNTGGSTAPHLHFELRDTETEHALNPLNYGFDIADSKKPEIRGVKVYSITKDGYRFPRKSTYRQASKGKTSYYVSNNEIVIPSSYCTESGGLGFAFDVIDRFDGASNRCGLFGSYLIIDGDTIFGQKIDRVPFESTRYVNSHKDYREYQTNKRKLHKSFKTTENDLPIYLEDGNGVFKAEPGKSYNVKFVAFDASGNMSILKFTVRVQDGEMNNDDGLTLSEDFLDPKSPYLYESEDTRIEMGHACVYEPRSINVDKAESKILDGKTPVNRAYKIKKKVANDDGKYYLQFTLGNGKRRNVHLDSDRDWLVAECKYFGDYCLKRDTIPPTITPINASSSFSGTNMKWRVQDGHSGLADYDVFIDGKWHLVEYEYKNSTMTFTRPSGLKGKKEVVFRAIDDCGNEKNWKRTINFL
jgi:hypothetical protein